MTMTLYALKTLSARPLRLAMSIGGIALCVVLMLFLLSVYRGVADGSLEYIRGNRVDLWVMQENASNIMRSTSVLFSKDGFALRSLSGVARANPVLLILTGVETKGHAATVYLAGFNPASGKGGPPQLESGRTVLEDGEIVLDVAFAQKHDFHVGDTIVIQENGFDVVGLSSGTNAFVVQYAFVSLKCAQQLLGFPGIVTCYLVDLKEGADPDEVITSARTTLPNVEVYRHDEFLLNNKREMQAGFLPFIYTITGIGVVVLTVILTLLLSISVLERRRELAIMKTLGASGSFLFRLVVGQSLVLTSSGTKVALVIFFPLVTIIRVFVPEISLKTSSGELYLVALLLLLIGSASALLAARRLRRIYALEAFQ
jgi:putative ABC transport system permease protein